MNCKEIKQKVDIKAVLESFSLFPVKENRKAAFYFALDREEKIPSLSVDFATGKNYDVISIVQQMKKCPVSEAIKYLERFEFLPLEQDLIDKKEDKDYQIISTIEIKHPALIQYLKSRKVNEQIHLIKEIHYKLNDKKFFGNNFLTFYIFT